MNWPKLIVVSLALLSLGCSSSPVQDIAEGETVIFEGLPHPTDESELLESEKKSKPTTILHGNYFYEQSQSAKDAEATRLRHILSVPEGFSTVDERRTKTCFFHADYAVAWKEEGRVHEVLICFGCGEAMRYGPKGKVREYIREETREKLKTILKMYDNVRPAHE